MSVYRSCLNRQRSTIRGLRAYGLGFKQNTESKTLPPDTPGYVEIRPACEARASAGCNRIRLNTFPVKGRYTRIHAIRPISMLVVREPAHDTTGYVAIRLPPALPAPHPDHPDTTRYVHYAGDRDKARYDRIRLDTLLFGRLLLDADMPGGDCCVHTPECLSSSSWVLLAPRDLLSKSAQSNMRCQDWHDSINLFSVPVVLGNIMFLPSQIQSCKTRKHK